MKRNNYIFYIVVALLLQQLLFQGCSNRNKTPITHSDSTISYHSKLKNGLEAKITLFRKMNRKTNEMIGIGTNFTIREKEKVYAVFELDNLTKNDVPQMFHIDWIGADKKSIFTKKIVLSSDSVSSLKSSISISPDKRAEGEYKIRIYHFRELIAEKNFELLKPFITRAIAADTIKTKLTLFKYISKKTGEYIGEGTVFTLNKKKNIRALLNIENKNIFNDIDLEIHFNWKNDSGKIIHQKRINVLREDTLYNIISSFSIDPEKRKAGKYILQILLFEDLIKEIAFELKTKAKIIKIDAEKLMPKLTLFRYVDKNTDERIGEAKVFTLKAKRNVRAYLDLVNLSIYKNRSLKFRFDWIDPEGKTFYRKKINITHTETTATLKSSISISPEKRKAGEYTLRLYLNKKLIREKKFELIHKE